MILIGFRQFLAIIAVVALIAFVIGVMSSSSTTRPLGFASAPVAPTMTTEQGGGTSPAPSS